MERKQEQERIVAQFEKRAPAEELPPAYEYKKILPEISGSIFQPNPIRNCI